ncbi:MAG: DUF2723 domain-containing protein [Anaerolineae bacterium]|nr:DUF2723 domain-containing protein [Anaerolineae bacterium]
MPHTGISRYIEDRRVWLLASLIIAFLVFMTTLQVNINSSGHPYATDVGEIQNALPRWGLIHASGYPLYTLLGSIFVTLLRWLNIEPCIGASLYSTLWGLIALAVLFVLMEDLGASPPMAAVGTLVTACSTSVWINASLSELHMMTLALSLATLLFALRFGRSGERSDLLWLTLFFSQGVVHQRSVVLLAPAVGVLILPYLSAVFRDFVCAVGVALLAPLTYLYMPLRVWMGATWYFGSPGTWNGFWAMLFDDKAGRVIEFPVGVMGWLRRSWLLLELLTEDLLWPLLLLGLAGVIGLAARRKYFESLALLLVWGFNFLLSLMIWQDRVTDALLAAKIPLLAVTGIGVALVLTWALQRHAYLGYVSAGVVGVLLVIWGIQTRPFIISITRDTSEEERIAEAARVTIDPGEPSPALIIPWGHDYWALRYAQTYRGQLPGLAVVEHDTNFRDRISRGERVFIQSKTFNIFPVTWWESLAGGRLYLTTAAPAITEMSLTPPLQVSDVPSTVALDLENGLSIRAATVVWDNAAQLWVTVYWEVLEPVDLDYSVAVHLVAQDPPLSGTDVLAQADANHPVETWYPTSRWEAGEIVRDNYLLEVPEAGSPVAVRIGMYRFDPESGFINSPWLSLPLPQK